MTLSYLHSNIQDSCFTSLICNFVVHKCTEQTSSQSLAASVRDSPDIFLMNAIFNFYQILDQQYTRTERKDTDVSAYKWKLTSRNAPFFLNLFCGVSMGGGMSRGGRGEGRPQVLGNQNDTPPNKL